MHKSMDLFPVHDPAESWLFLLSLRFGSVLCQEEKELYSVVPWTLGQKMGARFFLGVVQVKFFIATHE